MNLYKIMHNSCFMQFDCQLLFCMNGRSRKDNELLIYCFRYNTTLDLSVMMSVVFEEPSDLAKFKCAPRYQSQAKMFKDNVFK